MTRMVPTTPAAQQRIADIKKYGRQATGQAAYLRYLRGEALPASMAIKAMCYNCEGNAGDGVYDCGDVCCPLYPWHPYKASSTLSHANTCTTGKKQRGSDGFDHTTHKKPEKVVK